MNGEQGSIPAGWEVDACCPRSSRLPLNQAGESEGQGGSGPAGREVERDDRSIALPLAQPDDELDRVIRFKEGRAETKFTPPARPGSSPVFLQDWRRDPYRVRRTDAAEELIRSLMATLQLAQGQGIGQVEVDQVDLEAFLLHEAALMRVIEWASLFGPPCTCEGGHGCSWHAGLAEAMETGGLS